MSVVAPIAAPVPFVVELDAGARTTGLAYASAAAGEVPMLALAHGAGADQRHRFMVAAAAALAARGVDVCTFNFLYTEQGKRAPDRTPALESCWRHVIQAVRARARGPLFLAGKSMGGRIASHVAAAGVSDVAGLVFLGYPLHSPGKPLQLRDKHLAAVRAPMLFVQGTRDAFGTPDELAPVVARCAAATLWPVEGGDHSFAVPKRAPKAGEAVFAEVMDAVAGWIRERTR